MLEFETLVLTLEQTSTWHFSPYFNCLIPEDSSGDESHDKGGDVISRLGRGELDVKGNQHRGDEHSIKKKLWEHYSA